MLNASRGFGLLLATALVSALAAPGAAAQVTSIDQLSWTFVGPASASGTQSPGTLQVIGPDGFCPAAEAWFEAVSPLTGHVSVTLDWTSFDLCHYDWPIYLLDGASTIIPTTGSLGCFGANTLTVEFEVQAGQVFGLGVGSADCFKGAGVATWSGLSILPTNWEDLGGALDPRIEYQATPSPGLPSFGDNIVAIGLVDGDALTEYVVAAPNTSPIPVSGSISLRRGSNGKALWTLDGDSTFGGAMAAPGDVDGDLVPDIAVATWVNSHLQMLSGVDGAELWSWTWSGSSLDYYAAALATHADLDSDGIPDIAVGSNATPAKSVFVLSGATGALLATIPPAPGSDRFGGSLADLGDLSGDGLSDLGVVASVSPPRVQVYSGADASLVLELDAADGLPNLHFGGSRMLGLPDLDDDGVRDLAIGSRASSLTGSNDQSGVVASYSGATGAQLMQVGGPGVGAHFGTALAAVDIDNDGVPELAVGADGYELALNSFDDNGLVWIVNADTGAPRLEILGPAGGGGLGAGLAHLAGASQPTLLIGVPQHPEGPRVQAFADLQHLDGAPRLTMNGSFVSDTPYTLRIADGLPAATVGIVVGLSQIDAPLLGGTLVPDPTWIVFAQLNASGRLLVSGAWPAGIELAPPIWLQAWAVDPAGPEGWSASQGLRSP